MRARSLGSVVAALALIWLIGVRGYADYLARVLPERAHALNPRQPVAALSLAEEALRARRLTDATALAATALANDPLDGRALRVLGAVAELGGDRPRALQLMTIAARRAPRDAPAQFWLAINALADRDLPAAIARLDRLLRFEPAALQNAFPVLATIATNRIGAPALAPVLVRMPNWRPEFMSGVIQQAPDVRDLMHLAIAIDKAGGALTPLERSLYEQRLIAAGEWDQLQTLSGASDGVHDPGFDGSGQGPLTGWQIDTTPGADTLIRDSTLQISFYGRRVPYRAVSQMLFLRPGHYQLSGRVKLENLDAAQGMRWVVWCHNGREPLGATVAQRGSRDWSAFATEIQVPADCPAQWLRLELYARIAAEQQVSGRVLYDDVNIEGIP